MRVKKQELFQSIKDLYNKYQEFKNKGKLQLKKKVTQDHQEYYDFDFSCYPYYYNFPNQLLSLNDPQVQNKFTQLMIQFCENDFTLYPNKSADNKYEQKLKELLSQQNRFDCIKQKFLLHFKQRLKYIDDKKIFYLKSKKKLMKRSHKNSYQNQLLANLQQINQIQRRAYFNKVIRLSEELQEFKFGQNTKARLYPKLNEEGTSKWIFTEEQIQFSNFDKKDFVTYSRKYLHDERVMMNFKIIYEEIQILQQSKKLQILKNKNKYNISKIKHKLSIEQKFIEQFNKHLLTNLKSSSKKFNQSEHNMELLTKICLEFTRLKNLECIDIQNSYEFPPLVYFFKYELQEIIKNTNLIVFKQNLYDSNQPEYYSVKMNNYITTILRFHKQSLNYFFTGTTEIQSIEKSIQKQLDSIFQAEISSRLMEKNRIKLPNLTISSVQWDHLFEYNRKLSVQQEIISQVLTNINYHDSIIKSILNLFQCQQNQIRSFTYSYISKLKQIRKDKWKLLLNTNKYKNVNRKQRIIEMIIKVINLQQPITNHEQFLYKYISFLQPYQDDNLLSTTYGLIFTKLYQLKNKLLHVINAQNSIQKNVVYGLYLITQNQLPFQFTEKFTLKFSNFDKQEKQKYQHNSKDDNKDVSEPQEISEPDELIFMKDNQNIPFVFVKSKNRMDKANIIRGHIMYPKTLVKYKDLIKKIQKICSFFIQKHENNLPDTDFTELIDRYQILYDLFSWELKYQYNKLLLMQTYQKITKYTIQAQSLYCIYEKIMGIKQEQYIIDLTKNYFQDEYQTKIKILQKQNQIIKQLIKIMKNVQENQNQKFLYKIDKYHMDNQMPQLSRHYYMISQEFISKKQYEESSVKQNSMVDLNQNVKQQMNSKFYTNNQYLLKHTFKEILDQNQDQIQKQFINQKREKLMGYKQKIVMNDSLLGSPSWYKDYNGVLERLEVKQYQHLWNIIRIPEMINDITVGKNKVDIIYLYDEIIRYLNNFNEINIQKDQIFNEDLLSTYLDKVSNNLKNFNKNISKKQYQQDMLNLDLNIIKLLAQSRQNQINLTPYRGLYLCFNFIEILRLNQELILNKFLRKSLVESIKLIITQYGKQNIDKIPYFSLFQEQQFLISSQNLLKWPWLKKITNENAYQLFFSESQRIFRSIVIYQYSTLLFLKQIWSKLYNFVFQTQQLIQQFQLIINQKCSFKLKVTQIEDITGIKTKLKNINSNQQNMISKELLNGLIDLREYPKLQLTRIQLNQVNKSKFSIQQFINFKQNKNNQVNEIILFSINVFEFTKEHRYLRYLQNLRVKLQKITKMIPTSENFITIPKIHSKYNELYQQQQKLANQKLQNLRFPTINQIKSLISYNKISQYVTQIQEFQQFKYQGFQHINKIVQKYIQIFFNHQSFKEEVKIKKSKSYIQMVYEFWHEIWEFFNNCLIELSLQLNKEQGIRFIKLLQQGQNLKQFIFEENKEILSQQNIQNLKNRILKSELFQECEREFHIEQNLKKRYRNNIVKIRGILNNMKDLGRLNQYDRQSYNFLLKINRLKQLHLYIAIKQLKNLQISQTQIFKIYYSSNKPLLKFMNTPQMLNFKQIDQIYECPQYYNEYDTLKYFENPDYIVLKKLFENSPVDLKLFYLQEYKNFVCFRNKTSFENKLLFLNPLKRQNKLLIMQKFEELQMFGNLYASIKSENREDQIINAIYQKTRLKQLANILNISIQMPLEEINSIHKQMEVRINNGGIKLNKIQKLVLEYSKTSYNSVYYDSIVIKIKKIVIQKKIYEQQIIKYYLTKILKNLKNQIDLLEYLDYQKSRKKVFEEERIIKNLINPVLVPKQKLNPFFSSPLCITKYFIPHTTKLAFIQAFLNKLKNKVIQVELINNQFGFLIKTNELQQCVNYLCKSFIGFGEIEYKSQTKDFVRQYEILSKQYNIVKEELRVQKQRTKYLMQGNHSLVNTLVYNKTNQILFECYNQRKDWQTLLKSVSSIENQVYKHIKSQYQNEILKLKLENKIVVEQYQKYKKLMNSVLNYDISRSKNKLVSTLKTNITDIIKTNQEKDQQLEQLQKQEKDEQQKIQKATYEESQLYLKRLKTQKIFYEMKLNALECSYQNEKKNYEIKLSDKQKLHQSYINERKKNQVLMEQLNIMNQKIKKNESLIQNLNTKLQNQQHKSYKLERLLQSLNSKFEAEIKKKRIQLPTIIEKKTREFQTQTDFKLKQYLPKNSRSVDKSNQLNFSTDIKIMPRYADQFTVWKDKYQNLSKKYLILRNNLKQIKDLLKFSKDIQDYSKLLQNLTRFLQIEFQQDNKLYVGYQSSNKKSQLIKKHRRIKTTMNLE